MIGERIKMLRERNGYTQTVLARKLGLSRASVNAWEMGINSPSTQYLIQLAKLLNVSTDFILCIDNEQKDHLDMTVLTEDQKTMFRILWNQCRKYNETVKILVEDGLVQRGEELYEDGIDILQEIRSKLKGSGQTGSQGSGR